ncbi:glycosyltransferase family 2 protein [Persicobacter sp. CCB-QB2]|uniref:glycosyltransferase family 2 protein n=1 Tax=Persicobacter sp. CCB-QB2 TaxID=1561025 RepID=UPI0006A9850A|nr:glycosyltransferase [Persicobacter sp. CCB-QB2]
MTFAPIALFVYNRPDHTLKTLEALKANPEVAHSEIFIFADGPKAGADEKTKLAIQSTRDLVADFEIGGRKELILADQNKGLANSIIEGVSRILKSHGRIIVLEDDIVVAPGFLKFMNEALELYQNEDKVWHIGAYMPDLKRNDLPPLALVQQMQCWGWATWANRWEQFNPSSEDLLGKFDGRLKKKFDYEGSFNFHRMLRNQLAGKRDSWAIRWYATIFLAGGLCLNPSRSITENIGQDGSGQHSFRTTNYDVDRLDRLAVEKIPMEENKEVRQAMVKYYWKAKLKAIPQYILFLLFGRR